MYDSKKGTLVADMPELPIRYFPLVTHELLQRMVLKRMTIRNVLYHLGPHPHPSPLLARSFLPLPQVHRKHRCATLRAASPGSPGSWYLFTAKTLDVYTNYLHGASARPQTEQSRRGFLEAGLGICSSGGSIFMLISGHIL
jgi:hypothetical protein